MGQKLSALTFAPDLAASDLFYMAEDIGGGIFFERKVELSQLDSRWVNTSGDTMTGVLNMGGFTIDNLDFPVLGGQAANKAYVDALVGAGAPPFTDTISLVKGSVDTTKLLRFEVDGFTAATTRVLTPQNSDYTIAGLETLNVFTVNQTFSSTVSLSDGTFAVPSLRFTNEPTSGISRPAAGEIGVIILGTQVAEFVAGGLNLGLFSLEFSNGFGSAPDVFLLRDGPNNLAQRNGTDGQQYHLYNTYTDGLNFERLNLEWNANNAFLSTEQLGTGLFRNLALGSEGNATVSLRTNATNWFTVLGTGSMQGTLGIVTANTPILDLSQTWNNVGVTFTALKQNITNTNSAAGSLLIDMQVNSSTVWSLGKTGLMTLADDVRQTFNPGALAAGFNFGSVAIDPGVLVNGDSWYNSTANVLRFRINGATVSFGGDSVPPFTDTNALIKGSADATKLMRFEVDGFTTGVTRVLTPQNSDYILAGTNIANTFSVTQTFAPSTVNTSMILGTTYSLTGSNATNMIDLAGTWNTSGTPTAIKLNITNTASNAASLLMDLQASTLTKFNVSALGMTTITRVNSSATLNTTDPHLLFNNTSSQSMMVFAFSGTARGGLRADSSGNFSWHASGSQGHQFYSGTTAIDANCICGFSASGVVIGHATAGSVSVARLDVISKATTNIGQILKQLAGQTENMLQVRDSANTVLARLTAGGGFVFNENAADVDTRIEGDTNANLFFTDASTDRVGIGTATPVSLLDVNGTLTSGNHTMTVAAVLSIASGANQRAGNAVLVAGTVTVNNTTVTANTIVMLTRKTAGGTVGTLITYTVAAGTSFTINSDSALDTSTFSYMLIEVP